MDAALVVVITAAVVCWSPLVKCGAGLTRACAARAQIRNKLVSKHFTEKTVKEIWRDKQAEVKAGKQTELCEFVFHYLHKRIGILSAVIEARVMAYCECSFGLRCVARLIAWQTQRASAHGRLVCWFYFIALTTARQNISPDHHIHLLEGVSRTRAQIRALQQHCPNPNPERRWRAGGLQPAARPLEVQLGRGLRAVPEDHAGPGPRGCLLPADRPAGAHLLMDWWPPHRVCTQEHDRPQSSCSALAKTPSAKTPQNCFYSPPASAKGAGRACSRHAMLRRDRHATKGSADTLEAGKNIMGMMTCADE